MCGRRPAEDASRIKCLGKRERICCASRSESKSTFSISYPFREKVDHIKTFRILEEEIGHIAVKYARDYIKKDSSTDFNAILGMYKVLILPEKSMRLYLYFNFFFLTL